jgi:DNA repair protein RadD
MKLRYYQQEAIDSVYNKGYNSGIIACPTGTGKSVIIAELVNKSKGNTIIFQPTREILMQNFHKYLNYSQDCSIFSASLNKKELSGAIFSTIQTANNYLHLFKDVETIIIDECHLASSYGIYGNFIEKVKPKKIIGLSATPFRTENYQLKMLTRIRGGIFDKFFYIYQNRQAMNDGYWCSLKYGFNYNYDRDELHKTATAKDFREQDIMNLNLKMNLYEQVANVVNNTANKHILVFVSTIKECVVFTKFLQEKNISCMMVYGKNTKKEREVILKSFEDGKIRVLINVGVLTTGYDFPELDCVMLCRPTKSLNLYIQMVGRVLRTHPNKDHGIVYDFCGNVKEFGKVEDIELCGIDDKRLGLKNKHRFLIEPTLKYKQENKVEYGLNIDENKRLNAIAEMKMSFGKFKGEVVKQVPIYYLTWCIENEVGEWKLFQEYLRLSTLEEKMIIRTTETPKLN